MSYYADSLDKFNALPEEIKNQIGGFEALEKISALESAYGVKLKFLVILLAIGDLRLADIPAYLQKESGIDLARGEEIKKDLINVIFSRLVTDAVDELDIVEQKIGDYFKNHLVEVLQGEDVLKDVLNEDLLLLFAIEEEGHLNNEDLLKILLANQEKLTSKEFRLDARAAEPTAANWLKDFIKRAGSGTFDNLVSSKYAIDSENGKKLDEKEKKIIIDLLTVYRNLKFFPDVFGDAPVDQWNILPVKPSEVKKEIPAKTRETLELSRVKTAPGAAAPAESKPSSVDQEKLRQLQETLEKYPPRSLQRKAIAEELKKINKVKK